MSGADLSDVALGSVLCDPSQPIKVTSRIQARIVIFNVDIPITKGYPVSENKKAYVCRCHLSEFIFTGGYSLSVSFGSSYDQ